MSQAANAHNDGRSFEKSLVTICGIYASQRRAYLEKVEPPTRTIGFGAARTVLYLENPFLDFTGSWTEFGGRSLHIEAKSTSEPVLPCGDKGGFSRSQRNALAKWREAGAAAFLLWEYDGAVKLFFASMIAAGLQERKSLVWGDGLPVPAGKGYVFWDFLALAKKYPEQL